METIITADFHSFKRFFGFFTTVFLYPLDVVGETKKSPDTGLSDAGLIVFSFCP